MRVQPFLSRSRCRQRADGQGKPSQFESRQRYTNGLNSDNISILIFHPNPTNHSRLHPHYKARLVTRSNSCYPRLFLAYSRLFPCGEVGFQRRLPHVVPVSNSKKTSTRVSLLVAANYHGDNTILCEDRGRSFSFLQPFSLSSFLLPLPSATALRHHLLALIHLSRTGQSTAFGTSHKPVKPKRTPKGKERC